MKSIQYTFFAALTLLASGCEKEITLTLPNPPDQLVVEGRLERLKGAPNGPQLIILSTLANYFSGTATPRVTDAQVSIRDLNGTVYPFNHDTQQPGTYTNTSLVPEFNQPYTLTIVWRGNTYQAQESLVRVTDIDSLYQQFEAENTFEDGGIKVAIDFSDPANETNYYFWELLEEGQNVIKADPGNSQNIISSDRFFNGMQVIGYFPNEEKVFEPGAEVTLRQIGISRSQYDFLFQLFEQTGQTGQLIDVPPAAIRGNVVNLTDPR
ncbi:MAG TPA: hypothetical protein DCE81_09420, partial [Cytophagales bacterium]|nr:hypothetical protein [Cytophagales bacterium]